jgi:hypothetical protein
MERDGFAQGVTIGVQASIKPGAASTTDDMQPMTEDEAIAYDNDLLLLLLVT